jgi:hypothetical protein
MFHPAAWKEHFLFRIGGKNAVNFYHRYGLNTPYSVSVVKIHFIFLKKKYKVHTWNAWLSRREHFPFLPPLGTTPLPDPTILVPLSGDQSPRGVFSTSQAIVSLAQKHVRTHSLPSTHISVGVGRMETGHVAGSDVKGDTVARNRVSRQYLCCCCLSLTAWPDAASTFENITS